MLKNTFLNLEIQNVKIRQVDGYLNLSNLVEAYTVSRIKFKWNKTLRPEKLLESNIDRVYSILRRQKLINVSLTDFARSINEKGFNEVIKESNSYIVTGARDTKTVWVNPYIFLLVAHLFNDAIYRHCIAWGIFPSTGDEGYEGHKLLLRRIEAGKFNIEFYQTLIKFDPDWLMVGTMLNYIIFNNIEPNVRLLATKKQLAELDSFQSGLAFCIKFGVITSYTQLIERMKIFYKNKIF